MTSFYVPLVRLPLFEIALDLVELVMSASGALKIVFIRECLCHVFPLEVLPDVLDSEDLLLFGLTSFLVHDDLSPQSFELEDGVEQLL